MDALRGWATALCFAAVAAGMAGILAPQGNLEKIYKFVISLFFLACVLMPLFSLKNLDVSQFTRSVQAAATGSAAVSGNLQQTVEQQENQQAAENLATLVRQSCASCSVKPLSVTVRVSNESDGYKISGCRILLSKDDSGKKTNVAAAVKKDLGIDAAVEIKED